MQANLTGACVFDPINTDECEIREIKDICNCNYRSVKQVCNFNVVINESCSIGNRSESHCSLASKECKIYERESEEENLSTGFEPRSLDP